MSQNEPQSSTEAGITLLDLLIVLAQRKTFVLGIPLLAAIAAAILSLLMPNIYTGVAKILPPQPSQSSASAVLAQLGAVAGLAGGVTGIKNPNDMYVGMLKSRTVAENLIRRFELNKVYETKYQSNTVKQLGAMSTITSGKDGIITITVDDKDPKRAADLANAYIDELYKLTGVLAVTEASQRRLFFERQLAQAKENLIRAEASARQSLEKGGITQVEGQGRAMVENIGRLRGQITVKEVQVGAMRAFAAERNPELLLAQQELEVMKRELAKMEGVGDVRGTGNSAVNSSRGIDSLSLLRDVKYYETIYDLLAKQYELTKIDEAKDSALIQVLDKAIEPDRKSKPWRALIVVLSTLAALIAAILWAFYREVTARAMLDPRHAPRLQTLQRYLSWRRTA
jgi:tyrosine-protein kinase Etk/Wzc